MKTEKPSKCFEVGDLVRIRADDDKLIQYPEMSGLIWTVSYYHGADLIGGSLLPLCYELDPHEDSRIIELYSYRLEKIGEWDG